MNFNFNSESQNLWQSKSWRVPESDNLSKFMKIKSHFDQFCCLFLTAATMNVWHSPTFKFGPTCTCTLSGFDQNIEMQNFAKLQDKKYLEVFHVKIYGITYYEYESENYRLPLWLCLAWSAEWCSFVRCQNHRKTPSRKLILQIIQNVIFIHKQG